MHTLIKIGYLPDLETYLDTIDGQLVAGVSTVTTSEDAKRDFLNSGGAAVINVNDIKEINHLKIKFREKERLRTAQSAFQVTTSNKTYYVTSLDAQYMGYANLDEFYYQIDRTIRHRSEIRSR